MKRQLARTRHVEPISYDLHDVVRIDIEGDAPTLHQLDLMLAPFRVRSGADLRPADIVVGSSAPEPTHPSHGEEELRFDDVTTVEVVSGVTVAFDGDTFHIGGSRELLTFVLPLIDVVATRHGAAMIHAASFDLDGHGLAMPAWGGVGKTSTMAKMLQRHGAGFMGDDWAFVTAGQELLAYHKPMFIKPHHRPIYPHLFADKKKPMVPVRLSRPLHSFTSAVHPVITKYPKIAGLTRKFSPEHMMVTPARAFPEARMGTRVPLRSVVFVERFDGPATEYTAVSKQWMVTRMLGNFHIEMHRSSRELLTSLSATNLVPLDAHLSAKRAVLDAAIEGIQPYLLRVPADWSPDVASDVIVEHLEKAAAESGVEFVS